MQIVDHAEIRIVASLTCGFRCFGSVLGGAHWFGHRVTHGLLRGRCWRSFLFVSSSYRRLCSCCCCAWPPSAMCEPQTEVPAPLSQLRAPLSNPSRNSTLVHQTELRLKAGHGQEQDWIISIHPAWAPLFPTCDAQHPENRVCSCISGGRSIII